MTLDLMRFVLSAPLVLALGAGATVHVRLWRSSAPYWRRVVSSTLTAGLTALVFFGGSAVLLHRSVVIVAVSMAVFAIVYWLPMLALLELLRWWRMRPADAARANALQPASAPATSSGAPGAAGQVPPHGTAPAGAGCGPVVAVVAAVFAVFVAACGIVLWLYTHPLRPHPI